MWRKQRYRMSPINPSVRRLLVGMALITILGWGTSTAMAAISSISPSNGTTLTDASQIFSWAGSSNITEYWLNVGSTLGAKDLHDSGSLGTSTSGAVSNLPINGSTLYVRLWLFEEGNWLYTDFTFPAFTVAENGGLNAAPLWDQVLPTAMRFVLVMGGAAVLDRETGLVWEQSPQSTTFQWSDARVACTSRTVYGRKGWRLPSVNELASLLDTTQTNPALPIGHPFANILPSRYWLATTNADQHTLAWEGHLGNGEITRNVKASYLFAWCVRGGGLLSEY